MNGANLAALGISKGCPSRIPCPFPLSLLSISKHWGCSGCIADAYDQKDVRHESNVKFIAYSYPLPFTIITTISRHLQWLQSWECIQVIKTASPTALAAAPSAMGLILKGSVPLEFQWLIEIQHLLLASSENETRREVGEVAELDVGLVAVWHWRTGYRAVDKELTLRIHNNMMIFWTIK